jgi:hypothetical protein
VQGDALEHGVDHTGMIRKAEQGYHGRKHPELAHFAPPWPWRWNRAERCMYDLLVILASGRTLVKSGSSAQMDIPWTASLQQG